MEEKVLEGKRALVTLPLTEGQKAEFDAMIAAAGGTAAFILEPQVTDADVEGVSIIVGNVPARTLHAPACLEWLQTSSAGYDHYMAPGRLAAHTRLTNATGAYGQAVSEHMFASLLCLMKKLHLYRDNQRACTWEDEGPVTSLVGATVIMLGTGDIGTHFARLVSAMGAQVWGVRRNVASCHEPFVRMLAIDELPEVLKEADVVASALPSTPATRFLVNDDFLAAMKPGSYLVNAGRGDLIDQNALLRAVKSGHIAGAALDVTKPEPLPADHPLWAQERVLITPHISGFWHLQATVDNVVEIGRENLAAYLAGRPLRNEVTR